MNAFNINLEKVDCLQYLTPQECQYLLHCGTIIHRKSAEPVLIFGESVPGLFAVIKGAVAIYPEGVKAPVAVVLTNESFGEMGFLENTNASATVRAHMDDTIVFLIKHRPLNELLENNAQVAAKLYKGLALTLSKRLRETNKKVATDLLKIHDAMQNVRQNILEAPFEEIVKDLMGFVHTEGNLR